jgi:hypothetical protein
VWTYHRRVITALRERRVGTDASGDSVTSRQRWWLAPLAMAPLGAAIIYLAVVAIRLPGTLSTFYWYSDFPEALRLGDATFHGGYGHGLAVPTQSGIGPLWFVGMLNQVTGSEVAGMGVGVLIVAVATGFMVWTARRALSTAGASVVGALCIAAPPVVAWEFLTPDAHESTLLMTAVFAWQIVALAQRRGRGVIAKSVAVGLLASVCVVSDPLVLAAAVGPWLVCALLIARRHRDARRPLIITGGTAVAFSALLAMLANASGIVERGGGGFTPSLQGIAAGLRTTGTTLGQVFTGAWYTDMLPAAIVAAATGVFAVLLYFANRETVRRSATPRDGRDMYVWFWMLSSAGLIAALCVSGYGIQYDPVNYTGHYVDGLWFAIAALLPVGMLQGGMMRRVLAVGATALVIAAAVGVARMPSRLLEEPDYADGPQLTATLQQLGVTRGYGGYWESYAIGWHTDQRITALPLQRCAGASGIKGLCRYEFAAPAWYRSQPGPVFLIVLRDSCFNNDACISVSDLAALPPPESVHNVGLLQVVIYAHDVFGDLPMATRP